jgi:predicted AlkP superfamily pyrophosphatase or phosphodiesterase
MSHRKTTMTLLLSCGLASLATQAGQIQRTLLISVDGLHALDVANYVKSHPSSALAELASQGVTPSPDDRAAQHDG